MISLFLSILPLATIGLASTIYAGGYNLSPSGIYIGVGASHNTAAVKYRHFEEIQSGSLAATLNDFSNNTETYAPTVQIGWWSDSSGDSSFQWGVKAIYKYLNAAPHAVQVSIQDPAKQVTIDDQINHEVAAMFVINEHLTNKLAAYFGAGAVVFPSVQSLMLDNSVIFQYSKEKRTMWGVIGQLGFLYQITPSWFIDTTYSYAHSMQYAFNGQITNATTGYIQNRDLTVINQQITLTLNYLFNQKQAAS